MPPNVKITKDDIINASLEIVRTEGADALNARRIAGKLNCSTQPVFSNFGTMDELRRTLVAAAESLFWEYVKKERESGEYPDYKAEGMAYIRFAQEETELFKLLYMRDRTREDEQTKGIDSVTLEMVEKATGFTDDAAKLFHLEMWAFVHGIAAIVSTHYLEIDRSLISEMISDIYFGISARHKKE